MALGGQELWKVSFLGLLRRISARDRDVPAVGLGHSPRSERYRIGQCASLAFAPREIAEVREDTGRIVIEVFGLGVLGPNGPMPLHFTETTFERTEIERDRATADFLDLFHHRALALFYRAWASTQPTTELDRAEAEVFSRYPAALTGDDLCRPRLRALPPHALLAATGHRAWHTRTASGLTATLTHFFGARVAVQLFAPGWLPIRAADRNCLGAPPLPIAADPTQYWQVVSDERIRLGRGALLGGFVRDRQHRFRLRLGPMGFQRYLGFTPGGAHAAQLADWITSFVGDGLAWDASLWISGTEVVPCSLGASLGLGHAAWLGTTCSDGQVAGMWIASDGFSR
jgi:type VI secretion system protein ImpH